MKGATSMFKWLSTNTFNWIMITGGLLFLLEILLFNKGLLGTAVFFGIAAYIGWKQYDQMWAKFLFWIGIVVVFFTLLNTIAVRFIVVITIVLIVLDYVKSKNYEQHRRPTTYIDTDIQQEEVMIEMWPIFKQSVYGDQQTKNQAYEWNDINIHGGIGNRFIDLSNTVLPNDTAVISIRHTVGNIVIYIPYETEFMIHHSAIYGKAFVLNKEYGTLLNQQLSMKTTDYDRHHPRIKIITSVLSGDIEVRRI